MTSLQAAIQIKNGLNKLDSKDYPNIAPEKIQEAVNTAVQRFVRRRLPKKEANASVTEDIQILLKPSVKLSGSNKDAYFLSHKLPDDYFALSRVVAICNKKDCILKIPSDWVEDSNANVYLSDWSTQPSFTFEQTFHVLSGGKVKQYHNNDFEVTEIEVSYYRQPQYITIPRAALIEGGQGKDMTWEWKNDIADMIIEEAIWIISGNIEDYNRNQLSAQLIQDK